MCPWIRMRGTTLLAAVSTMALLAPSTTVAMPLAEGPSHVARAAIPSDFNGDGYADLAIGVPLESIGELTHSGAVEVLYGSTAGLLAAASQLWTQDTEGIPDAAEAYDEFGSAIASGDFDRDGFADIAVGAPGEDTDVEDGGAVHVIYGSPTGLSAARNQLWSTASLPGTNVRSAGWTLAAGDFDGDGYWDLAIGASTPQPDPTLGTGGRAAGPVIMLRGGHDGLSDAGAIALFRPGNAPSDPLDPDRFGDALAAGDLDGDGYADLAIAGDTGRNSGGDVSVFYGGPAGLSSSGMQLWTQDSPGIEGAVETNDTFGTALAIGDFNADGTDDLAIGVPGEPVPDCRSYCWDGGAVNVIYGSAGGLTADGNQLLTQEVPGVPGSTEYWDEFGHALAVGDFDGDGADDLAIGVPGNDRATRPSRFARGAVTVLYGHVGGLSAERAQRWTQASAEVPGSSEPGDRFGSGLASADYDGSGQADLAVGVPQESHHGVNRAGLVNVIYGQDDGLTGAHAQGWSRASPGIAGEPTHEYFGLVLGL